MSCLWHTSVGCIICAVVTDRNVWYVTDSYLLVAGLSSLCIYINNSQVPYAMQFFVWQTLQCSGKHIGHVSRTDSSLSYWLHIVSRMYHL